MKKEGSLLLTVQYRQVNLSFVTGYILRVAY